MQASAFGPSGVLLPPSFSLLSIPSPFFPGQGEKGEDDGTVALTDYTESATVISCSRKKRDKRERKEGEANRRKKKERRKGRRRLMQRGGRGRTFSGC